MPPRQKTAAEPAAALTDEQKLAQSEHVKLVERAVKAGVLVDPEAARPSEGLKPTKVLVKSNGKDIVKKSSVRKNRYMVVLNAKLAPAAAGKLGTLAKLDSKNPVLYIDFPQGRLKFFGTLVFPKNKYMVLKAGHGADILCEDVFENLLVFSEAWWVGTAEENPNENKLPLPEGLVNEKLHSQYDFCYGAGFHEGQEQTVVKKVLPKASSKRDQNAAEAAAAGPSSKRNLNDLDEENGVEDGDLDDDEDEVSLKTRLKRRKTIIKEDDTLQEPVAVGALKTEDRQADNSTVAVPKTEDEDMDDSPVLRAPNRSKGRKAVIEGTPSAGGVVDAEAAVRRESLRRVSTKRQYVEKSDDEEEQREEGDGNDGDDSKDGKDGTVKDEQEEEEEKDEDSKPAKRSHKEKSKEPKASSKSSKRTPASQENGKPSAASKKGVAAFTFDDDGAILLASDTDTPAKPTSAKAARGGRKSTPLAKLRGTPPAAGLPPAAVTIELLDDTPTERGTPGQRPQRSAGAVATKRLAALRESDAAADKESPEEEDKSDDEDKSSGSGDDAADSDFTT